MQGTCLQVISRFPWLAAPLLLGPMGCGGAGNAPPGKAEATGALPQRIVKAWEEAGAEAGWMTVGAPDEELFGGGFYSFSPSGPTIAHVKIPVHAPRPDATRPFVGKRNTDRPAFGFDHWKPGLFAKLPIPEAPFGLIVGPPGGDLNELARLKTLEILDLSTIKVTDAGLKELAPLKGLKALNLRQAQVTGPGLPDLKRLEMLSLEHSQITDAGLAELAGLKNLQWLDLSKTEVTDAGLKELAALTGLQTLYLKNTQVTATGFRQLAGHQGLQTLNLSDAQVTDAGLKELAGLRGLQALDLGGTRVTDAGIKELRAFKNLQSLRLIGTKVTDAAVADLAALKSLTFIALPKSVTAAGAMQLRKALPGCAVAR